MSRALWSQEQYDAYLAKQAARDGVDRSTGLGADLPDEKQKQRKAPNRTEREYHDKFLWPRVVSENATVQYEGIRLYMMNGHSYRGDWALHLPDGSIEIHEVKGSYHLHSHQRARLAFDQARIEWPCIKFVWAEKSKDGWKIT